MVELACGGSVINGAYPVKFIKQYLIEYGVEPIFQIIVYFAKVLFKV